MKKVKDQALVNMNCKAVASELSNFENFKMSIDNGSEFDKTV